MPEPTCSIALVELQSKVGYFLGRGRGPNYGERVWTVKEQHEIDDCVNSGLHRFYHPVLVGMEPTTHSWSFLKPTRELALSNRDSAIELPADFGGLEGDVLISSPNGRNQRWLRAVSTPRLDMMAAHGEGVTTGSPQSLAIRPKKGTNSTQGQRYELAIWPIADQDYTLKLTYTIVPAFLTTLNPYPYGGPIHRETVLESCLAVAENRMNDEATLHKAEFMQQLQASISADRRFMPKNLGYNGDGGERDDGLWNQRRWPTVTFSGVEPE